MDISISPTAVIGKDTSTDSNDYGGWWNFRASHSDGLEYGDLDPRFIDTILGRELRDTDVVTEYAINPTSSKTRKGGFARRNPAQYEALTTRKANQQPKKQRNQQKRRQAAQLTPHEQQLIVEAWKQLEEEEEEEEKATTKTEGKQEDNRQRRRKDAIKTIISLNDRQFQPWIPEVADRLMKKVDAGIWSQEEMLSTLEELANYGGDDDNNKNNVRFSSLVQKLLSKCMPKIRSGEEEEEEGRTVQNDESPEGLNNNSNDDGVVTKRIDWSIEPWKSAGERVQHLSMSILEHHHRRQQQRTTNDILKLPQSPIFVNTTKQLMELHEMIILHNDSKKGDHDDTTTTTTATNIIALDIEWRDDNVGNNNNNQVVAISTLQVALVDSKGQISSFVIDLMIHDDDVYQNKAQAFIRDLFSSNNNSSLVLLGFAFGNDLPLLETYTGTSLQQQQQQQQHFLDIQRLFFLDQQQQKQNHSSSSNNNSSSSSSSSSRGNGGKGNLPGLQSCAALHSKLTLSKEQQCSDWGRRPLTDEQLEYAGLDAAVLLVLLAEYLKNNPKKKEKEKQQQHEM